MYVYMPKNNEPSHSHRSEFAYQRPYRPAPGQVLLLSGRQSTNYIQDYTETGTGAATRNVPRYSSNATRLRGPDGAALGAAFPGATTATSGF